MVNSEIVKWFRNCEFNKQYKAIWHRSAKVQEFVESIEEKNKIVGVIFSDNNIGFILDSKEK